MKDNRYSWIDCNVTRIEEREEIMVRYRLVNSILLFYRTLVEKTFGFDL